jgi:hypothetical protein
MLLLRTRACVHVCVAKSIIGGVLAPNHRDTDLIPASWQHGDYVAACMAWHFNDIFAPPQVSPPLLSSSAAPPPPLRPLPKISVLPSLPLSARSLATDRSAFIQLTGARAHEWLSIGGIDLIPNGIIADVMTYNTMTDTWSHDSMMNTPLYDITVAIMPAIPAMLAATTTKSTSSSSSAAAAAASAKKKKKDKKCVTNNDESPAMVFTFGGLRNARGDIDRTCEVYNTATREWTLLTETLNVGRSRAAAIWIPHWHAFVVCGGEDGYEHNLDSIELYSPATNMCLALTARQWQLPEPQGGHHLHLLNDTILVVTRSSMWAYQPSVPAGWVIDLSYDTIEDVFHISIPLTWRALPYTHHGDTAVQIDSSFIITL